MKQLRTQIEIQSTPERVWQVLTNFSAFPDWNPFIRSVEGDLEEGARLKVQIKPPKGMGMTIRPTVLKVEVNAEVRWTGSLLRPGVFDGEHFFLDPAPGGRRPGAIYPGRIVQGCDGACVRADGLIQEYAARLR